jgi:hypothetical protein
MKGTTPAEYDILNTLGEVWNKFLELPRPLRNNTYDDDLHDFRKAIHDAQRIVMSFPAQRQLLIDFPDCGALAFIITEEGEPQIICKGCGRSMQPEDNCGGDCVQCMAEAGDPECMEAVALTPYKDSDGFDHNCIRCDEMADHDCTYKCVGETGTCCVCAEHGCVEAKAERMVHPATTKP